jgi:hypothetical protein
MFNLATAWKRVVGITPWQLHPHRKSSHFTRGRKLGKHQNSSKRGRKHRNISLLAGIEPKFLCCPVHRPAFWTDYRGKLNTEAFQVSLQNCEKRLLTSPNMSVCLCLSVHPHAITRCPLEGFSWNLIFEDFRKSVQKIQFSIKFEANNWYLIYRHLYIDDNISRILIVMKNVSDKGCRENQNTHFVFINFSPPPKVVPFVR